MMMHLPLKASLPCAYSQRYRHYFIGHNRFASTSSYPTSTPFPFPAHRNPAPHQIFHLPSNASQADIKARCTSARLTHVSTLHLVSHRLLARADLSSIRTVFTSSP